MNTINSGHFNDNKDSFYKKLCLINSNNDPYLYQINNEEREKGGKLRHAYGVKSSKPSLRSGTNLGYSEERRVVVQIIVTISNRTVNKIVNEQRPQFIYFCCLPRPEGHLYFIFSCRKYNIRINP